MITFFSSLLSIDVIKQTKTNLGGGKSYFSLYVTVHHEGKTQTETEVETMKEFCLLAFTLLFYSDRIFYIPRTSCPRMAKSAVEPAILYLSTIKKITPQLAHRPIIHLVSLYSDDSSLCQVENKNYRAIRLWNQIPNLMPFTK